MKKPPQRGGDFGTPYAAFNARPMQITEARFGPAA